MTENEEFEFRARAEKEAAMGKQKGPDWKGVVSQAAREATMRPGTNMRSLMTNPETQAKALPSLAGTFGAMSPLPGGATLGTVGGRQLSNMALRAYGKPEEIPSTMSQVAEGGLSALGDITAIPALKKAYFGAQIGKAEKAAGLANIEKEAPPSGMRTAVKFVQGLKNKMNTSNITPEEARSLKPALDTIWKKGWLHGSEYAADLQDISKRVQTVLNQIPGRGQAAEGMARALTIPRMIGNTYKKIPPNVRKGLGYGLGAGLGGGTGFEVIKKLLGG